MRSIRFFASGWLAALGTLALIACGGGGGDSGATGTSKRLTQEANQAASPELADVFAATLTGAQAVPQRISGTTGSGTIVINPLTRRMTAALTTNAIAGADAHIHQAPPGMNGPIIFPLTETSLGSGIWTTQATLTETQYNAFRAGDYYFDVHIAAFPASEIRGQILPQAISQESISGDAGRTGTAGLVH